jgi:ABC-type sugar transport system ATPase subunit
LFIAEFLNPDVSVPAINCIDGELLSKEFTDVTIGVRPKDILIHKEMKQDCIEVTVSEINTIPLQKAWIVTAHVKENPLAIKATDPVDISPGDIVWLEFEKYHTFNKDTGKKIRSYI